MLEAADALELPALAPRPLAADARRRFTVGFVVPDVSSPFYASALKGAQVALEQAGYRVMLMDCEQSAEGEVAALQTLLAHRVDGLLVSTVGIDLERLRRRRRPPRRPVRLLRQRRPRRGRRHACCSTTPPGSTCSSTTWSAHGHERIGLLAGSTSETSGHERRAAFRSALARHGLDLDAAHVAGERWTREDGHRATREHARPRAAHRPRSSPRASSSRSAAIAACRELGLRIPDDVALATFDDAYFAELLDPPLTAVAYDPSRGRPPGGRAPRRGDARRRAGPRRDVRDPGATSSTRRSCGCHGVSATAPAIRLVGVSKRYGTTLALRETDLEIAEGEFFCLLGPSGCGKTTTLNLIGGFVNPSSGEIYIRDERVDAHAAAPAAASTPSSSRTRSSRT